MYVGVMVDTNFSSSKWLMCQESLGFSSWYAQVKKEKKAKNHTWMLTMTNGIINPTLKKKKKIKHNFWQISGCVIVLFFLFPFSAYLYSPGCVHTFGWLRPPRCGAPSSAAAAAAAAAGSARFGSVLLDPCGAVRPYPGPGLYSSGRPLPLPPSLPPAVRVAGECRCSSRAGEEKKQGLAERFGSVDSCPQQQPAGFQPCEPVPEWKNSDLWKVPARSSRVGGIALLHVVNFGQE